MTEKRALAELLPFYVNGSLSADERQIVEKASQEDPSLRDEIAFLQVLRDGMTALKQENSPGALGLQRLKKSLHEEKIAHDPIARARSKITKEQNLGLWRATAIAACLLLLLQTAILFSPERTDFMAADGPKAALISVTFKPRVAEKDIRALLIELNIKIVGGPSALGVYQVSGEEEANRLIEKLLARGDIVETAQKEKN